MIARVFCSFLKQPLIPANTYKYVSVANSYVCGRFLISQNRTVHVKVPPKQEEQYSLHNFGTITDDNKLEKIQNFDIVANEGFKNYVLFCVYAELLSSYLYPFMVKWVTDGLGCMSKGSKRLDDTDYCTALMRMWHYQGNHKPMPPLDDNNDYNQANYRIRVIAGREELLVHDDFQLDYDLIKEPMLKSPPSLTTIIKCIRFFPWKQLIQAEDTLTGNNIRDYKALKGIFRSSTDYFRYAMLTYVSNNSNNFTIDHDVIGRFWFNQDCLFKCLHQFARLSNGVIEFPLDGKTAAYLQDLRVASLERDNIVRNLLINKKSQHFQLLAEKKSTS